MKRSLLVPTLAILSMPTLLGACATEDIANNDPSWRVSAVHHSENADHFDVVIGDDEVTVSVSTQEDVRLAVLQDEDGQPLVTAFADRGEAQLFEPDTVQPIEPSPDLRDPYVAVTVAAAQGELTGSSLRLFPSTHLPGQSGPTSGTVEDPWDELERIGCERACLVSYLVCRLHNCEAGPDDPLNPFCADDYKACVAQC